MIRLISIIILIAVLAGCKKGVDDPAFTVLSRKNRITGSWTLYLGAGNRAFDYTDMTQTVSFTETYNYKNFTNSVVLYEGATESEYDQDMYVYFRFYNKDSLEEIWTTQEYTLGGTAYNQTITKKGTWNWDAGDGKSKSHILINYYNIENMADCAACDTTEISYIAGQGPWQLIKINRLSKREFNIEWTINESDNDIGSTDISEWTMQFIKD